MKNKNIFLLMGTIIAVMTFSGGTVLLLYVNEPVLHNMGFFYLGWFLSKFATFLQKKYKEMEDQ